MEPESDRESPALRMMTRLVTTAHVVPDRFLVEGAELDPDDVTARLTPYLSADRRLRIEQVLDDRTYGIVTVVEGLANSGNVSAVMRTAEGFGFQRFDLVAGDAPYKHSRRTAQGADKWLDVRGWREPEACVASLREDGYRILAAHLDARARPIDTFDFSKPTALVFGNEQRGVSTRMLNGCDEVCMVPIGGFVQSFNISVAAAVALYHARHDRVRRLGRNGDIDAGTRARMRAEFYRRSVRSPDMLLAASLGTMPIPGRIAP